MINNESQHTYLYTFVHHKNEHDLCRMEMRAFFGADTPSNFLFSNIEIDPSRSPFMEERLDILFAADSLEDLKADVAKMTITSDTFKVICLNKMDLGETLKIPHPQRRHIERELGLAIDGEPDLDYPEMILGIVFVNNRWYFGKHTKSISVWREHLHKPNSYSTALNTRVARAIANIAVPFPEGVQAIDPCCGIGTVVVEALSMGIQIEGRDINPLVCHGTRENIAYFGLEGTVSKGPIAEIEKHYDVAIIDLPYNVYTHITKEEQSDIIRQARRIADRCVIVTIETIDDVIEEVGFDIVDRCTTVKQSFVRQILLCQ